MTNEKQIAQLQRELDELKSLFFKDSYSDLEIFRKKVQFNSDVILGSSVGVQTAKLGFYGITSAPIVQQATFTTPIGGETVDTQARIAINSIKIILTNLGITN